MTDVRPLGGLASAPVKDIAPHPDNPRDRLTGIDELAASMKEVGLLQPIVCEKVPGIGLRVIAGHRRLAAAKRLRWTHVAVIIRRDMLPDEALAAMLIENGQRADLDPIEEARALRRLKEQRGGSDADLARYVGRNQVYVSGRLALLALSPAEQEEVRAKQINVVDAIARGRTNSGKVRRKGSTGYPHLGLDHDLAKRAKARCSRLQHRSRGRNSVGGVACGECWESVIRADERDQLHAHSAQTGRCALCETPLDPGAAIEATA